jgi:hypothetical protein
MYGRWLLQKNSWTNDVMHATTKVQCPYWVKGMCMCTIDHIYIPCLSSSQKQMWVYILLELLGLAYHYKKLTDFRWQSYMKLVGNPARSNEILK